MYPCTRLHIFQDFKEIHTFQAPPHTPTTAPIFNNPGQKLPIYGTIQDPSTVVYYCRPG